MNKEPNEIKEYFESLGYIYSWDFSRKLGETWHEIYKGSKLIAQIDMGVPLKRIKTDLSRLCLGLDFTEGPDYKVNGGGKDFDEMIERVFKSNIIEGN